MWEEDGKDDEGWTEMRGGKHAMPCLALPCLALPMPESLRFRGTKGINGTLSGSYFPFHPGLAHGERAQPLCWNGFFINLPIKATCETTKSLPQPDPGSSHANNGQI
jgi:hypothetical protein